MARCSPSRIQAPRHMTKVLSHPFQQKLPFMNLCSKAPICTCSEPWSHSSSRIQVSRCRVGDGAPPPPPPPASLLTLPLRTLLVPTAPNLVDARLKLAWSGGQTPSRHGMGVVVAPACERGA